MSDTVLKTSSLAGTMEAVVNIAPLKITGEQTIRNSVELHNSFVEYLNRGLDIVVDLSEVDVCDTAALQLIYALRQSVLQRKQRFHIAAVSPAIIETAAALGLCIEDLTTACGPAIAEGAYEAAGIDNGI